MRGFPPGVKLLTEVNVDNGFSSAAIVINNNGMGYGDDELRAHLLTSYLRTLVDLEQAPQAILLYAEGVKMATLESVCRVQLDELSDRGALIIISRTCLEHYGLLEKVPSPEIGNMAMIAEAQSTAEKVVTL
jgi:hypothetical protein